MDEEQGERAVQFELTAWWVDYVDKETGAVVTMTPTVTRAAEERRSEIAAPFRGSYAQCAVRANEILAGLTPIRLRWVPLLGVLPKLTLQIDSIAADG